MQPLIKNWPVVRVYGCSLITYDDLVKQFFENIVPGANPDDCWGWNGLFVHGYAVLRFNGKMVKGSRLSWEMHSGLPLRDKLIMCHSCNRPECCNPRHVEPDTHKRNMEWMRQCGRERHPKGDELASKITAKQVSMLRADHATGHYSFRTLGNKYGISKTHARNICRGKKWKCITEGVTPNIRPQEIQDEFTNAPISRSMKHYFRWKKKRDESGNWQDGRSVQDEFSNLQMTPSLRYYYRRIKKQLPTV